MRSSNQEVAAIHGIEQAFVGSVRHGLAQYNERSGCCGVRFFQTDGSKTAYAAISKMLAEVDAKSKTANDLRDVLAQYESTMGKSLKLDLGSMGATSSRYDADIGFTRFAFRV